MDKGIGVGHSGEPRGKMGRRKSALHSNMANPLMTWGRRDKIDTLLEPLQAMIQLALLSVSPLGTKLQINENILSLQRPTLLQPLTRWYHADKKDDLYYLYMVIKRFIKWYAKSPEPLYRLLTEMVSQGLEQLFKTYRSADAQTVIHVIQMYKNMLETKQDRVHVDEYLVDVDRKINIDEVFERITGLYDEDLLLLIYHALRLIQKQPTDAHVLGLTQLLGTVNGAIQEWIRAHLVV
jgi:hypothetical protein